MKNIPENTPIEQLKELFQRHGEVTRAVMPPAKIGCKRDFGFVHFAERSSALKAVKDGESYEVNGIYFLPLSNGRVEISGYTSKWQNGWIKSGGVELT